MQTPAAHLKKWQRINIDSASELPNLQRYARGEKFEYGSSGLTQKFAYGPAEASLALGRLALELTRQAEIAALSGAKDWLPVLNQAVSYSTLSFAMDFAWHEHAAREARAGRRRQPLRMLSLRDTGLLAGAQLSLGHLAAATATAAACRAALAANYCTDGDTYMPRRAQFLVLQLIADWRAEKASWPRVALDEPVYARLRESWRSPDAAAIAGPLLAACDRHQAEARPHDDQHYFDCEAFEAAWFPFEIHAVLRLRETLGLPNPALEHPLLATALGPLPPAQTPFRDELMSGIAAAAGIAIP